VCQHSARRRNTHTQTRNAHVKRRRGCRQPVQGAPAQGRRSRAAHYEAWLLCSEPGPLSTPPVLPRFSGVPTPQPCPGRRTAVSTQLGGQPDTDCYFVLQQQLQHMRQLGHAKSLSCTTTSIASCLPLNGMTCYIATLCNVASQNSAPVNSLRPQAPQTLRVRRCAEADGLKCRRGECLRVSQTRSRCLPLRRIMQQPVTESAAPPAASAPAEPCELQGVPYPR